MIDNLARIRSTVNLHESGTVLSAEPGCYRVETSSGEFVCRRAVSCLVEPVVGDRVLMFADAEGPCHVLAVLERVGDATVELTVDGDAHLVSRTGAVHVRAPEGIRLEGAAEVTAVTKRFRVIAEKAELATRTLLAAGERIDAQVGSVKLFARTMDRFVDHVMERCKTVVRVVEESETVRAKRVDVKAEELLAIRGENTVVTAESLVKMDGRQIHFG